MNLYWSIYKNLEKQLIALADVIHFDDRQSDVYSIHIADLLIRTAIEIEAISKHLYEVNGGEMKPVDGQGKSRVLYFDSDCIQDLDLKWHITKKVVNVVASNFYFEKTENLVLRPLKDCNKQGCGRWKKAYQAVKHDRIGSLAAGNIANLIRAMAALYILNIYNLDDKISDLEIGTSVYDTNFGSSVFDVNVYRATMISMDEHIDDNSIVEGTYTGVYGSRDATVLIDKYTKESFVEMHKASVADMRITRRNADKSTELKEFLVNHPEYIKKSLTEICVACGEELERKQLGINAENGDISEIYKKRIQNAGQKMLMSVFSFENSMKARKAKRELVLNKLQQIYPSL